MPMSKYHADTFPEDGKGHWIIREFVLPWAFGLGHFPALGPAPQPTGHGLMPSRRFGRELMGNSKNADRKTARMPATKFSHLQKKLKKGKTPPESKKRNKP